MKSNDVLDRNEFFNNELELDKAAVKECAEFYYTDIYLLNNDEKAELIKTLKSFYLEEVMNIKSEENQIVKENEESAKQLELETEERKKMEAEELEKKKQNNQKGNNKLSRSIQDMREYRLSQEERKEKKEKERLELIKKQKRLLAEKQERARKLKERRARYGY